MKHMTKLREILFKEIDSLRSGHSTVERANSVSKLAAQIVYSTRMDIEEDRLKLDYKLQDNNLLLR